MPADVHEINPSTFPGIAQSDHIPRIPIGWKALSAYEGNVKPQTEDLIFFIIQLLIISTFLLVVASLL
jgi:hypothetical protein